MSLEGKIGNLVSKAKTALKGLAYSAVIGLTLTEGVREAKAATLYVDLRANGANNGSSWNDAYNYLQKALTVAQAGDEIRVAQGVYKPGLDHLSSFRPKSGLVIKGGYAGVSQSHPDNRNINMYETVLSGDINGDDIEIVDPCDLLNHPSRAENSYHVLWISNGTAMLDGFTVTGGNANYGTNEHLWGGGLLQIGGSLIITNCKFTNNSAASIGGAMVLHPSASGFGAVITNCIFNHNYTRGYGGAIWSDYGWLISVSNCTFVENSSGYVGGGVYFMFAIPSYSLHEDLYIQDVIAPLQDRNPALKNCIFCSNRVKSNMDEFAQIDGYPRWDIRDNVEYSCVQGWTGGGIGNFDADPCFADHNNEDYHLKSQAGRWDANERRWMIDEVTSLCIDAGDPASPIGLEPFPNGGIINMGAYGGTVEASKSYFGEPVCETIVAGDINGDCIVNFKDFAILAFHWLEDH